VQHIYVLTLVSGHLAEHDYAAGYVTQFGILDQCHLHIYVCSMTVLVLHT